MQLNNCPETNESSKIHMILIQIPFVLDAIASLENGDMRVTNQGNYKLLN